MRIVFVVNCFAGGGGEGGVGSWVTCDVSVCVCVWVL